MLVVLFEYIKDNKMDNLIALTDLLKNILSIIGVITAGVFGYLVIQKSLKQETISKKISAIDESNSKLQTKVLEFLEKWHNKTSEKFVISQIELNQLLADFNEIVNVSINCETITANFAVITKWFLDNIIDINKYSNEEKNITNHVLTVVFHACDRILVITAKQVIFPSVWKIAFMTRNTSIYSRHIRKYASNCTIQTMNFFDQGVNIRDLNAETISLVESVNSYWDPILQKAMYRSINSSAPLSVLMILNKIYFPPILVTQRYDDETSGYWKLALIGFRKNVQLGNNKTVFYEFRYTTDRYGLGIVQESIERLSIAKCSDGFIIQKNNLLPSNLEIYYSNPGTIVIKINEKLLMQYSKKYLRKSKLQVAKMHKEQKKNT